MNPLFFVTTDPSMGLGIASWNQEVWIVTIHKSKLVDRLRSTGYKIWCLEDHAPITLKTTGHLLQNNQVINFIKSESRDQTPNIMVFKNSPKIEHFCHVNNFRLIANSVQLSSSIENKLNLSKFVPVEFLVENIIEHADSCKNLPIESDRFVIQTKHGWAGSSTYICTKEQLPSVIKTLGSQLVKISKYINSPTLTVNACVTKTGIISSPLAWQLNPPNLSWASKLSSTCGRQWDDNFDEQYNSQKNRLVSDIGKILNDLGYKGFFGLDLVVDDGKLKVIEINPRLTASESFYSRLEINIHRPPMIAYHLDSFLNELELPTYGVKPSQIVGTQLVLRSLKEKSISYQDSISTDLSLQYHSPTDNFHKLIQISLTSSVGELQINDELIKFESNEPLAKRGQLDPELSDSLYSLGYSKFA